ncbi:MAG: hypothetical protein JHD16_17275 [Solirubrobacteraceae bacterium]|nr:hypothetical protein [Solirubrobacteraceae bacterium]
MIIKRLATLALLLAAVLGSTPSAARATEFGLSEQQATSWSDGRLQALGVRHARLIAPWDAATSEPARVQAWLDAVAAAGLTPHVAFEHLRSDNCPGTPCALPSRAQYRAAVQAFRARFPQVTTFTTWNEANHSTQPVAQRPETAAGYWAELTAACPSCTVVAGDVLDSGGYVRWLQRFQAAAPTTPLLWGLHNYGDVTYGTTSGTDAVLAAVPGELWIEETGGIVTLRNSSGRITLSSNESRAAASVHRAFDLIESRPRIGRMYLYHWKAHTLADRFDAGLLRPDGSIRPSYTAAQQRLAGQPSTGAPLAPSSASSSVSVTVRWSTVRRNQLLVRVRCRAASRVCRGRFAATVRTQRTSKAKRQSTQVAKRRTFRTTAARPAVTIRVTVPKAVRSRVRSAAVRRLAITTTESIPATATGSAMLRLGRS